MSDPQTISTEEKPRPAHLFGPGNNANPAGRPKGSRNRLSEAFVAALSDDFEKRGAEAIVEVRETQPAQYLKVIASILPKELTINPNALSDMGDDELVSVLAAIRALAAAVGPALAGEGSQAAAGREPAEELSPLH